ncbi:hypothetical protein C5B85_01865 [Pseudoclavibacter sp. AY1F1]|uniref:hypothetical protein n=1 Tax=Pseudoclavibacter sp. AY1F1 TaxID=2080583 RepID=UPI000CE85EDF|nr:hypothetical protein [Pseudoclavibacter sp. AY1F1]PPF47046.1 hypothetical protein C5B85_01865 [Pseudoclavibacter sp. AY1F1]
MTEGPAEWLGAWATVGGTAVAALVALGAAVSSWLNRKKAKASADAAEASAKRSAKATERIAAALELSEERREAEQRVTWRAYRKPGELTGTVFVLANIGKRAARGVRIEGTGQYGTLVEGWQESIDIEGETSRQFKIDVRVTLAPPDLRVFWTENPEGQVVHVD